MEGGRVGTEHWMVAKVSAAARFRGVGFFEFLSLMKQAREEHGAGAESFELAWTLAFAYYKPPEKPSNKSRRPRA